MQTTLFQLFNVHKLTMQKKTEVEAPKKFSRIQKKTEFPKQANTALHLKTMTKGL